MQLDALALQDTFELLEERYEKGQETRELVARVVGRLREFLGESEKAELRVSTGANGTSPIAEVGPATAEEADLLRSKLATARQRADFHRRAMMQMKEKNLRFLQEIEELKKGLEKEATAARDARRRLREYKRAHGVALDAADASPPPFRFSQGGGLLSPSSPSRGRPSAPPLHFELEELRRRCQDVEVQLASKDREIARLGRLNSDLLAKGASARFASHAGAAGLHPPPPPPPPLHHHHHADGMDHMRGLDAAAEVERMLLQRRAATEMESLQARLLEEAEARVAVLQARAAETQGGLLGELDAQRREVARLRQAGEAVEGRLSGLQTEAWALQEEVTRLRGVAEEAERLRREAGRLREAAEGAEARALGLQAEVVGLKEELAGLRGVNHELRNQMSEGERARAERSREAASELDVISGANRLLQTELESIQRQLKDRQGAMEHEAATWRLAAEQAAAVAEKAQHQVQILERRYAESSSTSRARGLDLEARQHEVARLKQELEAVGGLLRRKEVYLEKVNQGVIQPLNEWYKANFDSTAEPMPASLPKSRGFQVLKAKAEKLLGGDAASVDSGADQQVVMASAAFELLAGRIDELREMAESLKAENVQHAKDLSFKYTRQVEELRETLGGQVVHLEGKLQDSGAIEQQLRLRLETIDQELSRAVRERHVSGDREEALRQRLADREDAWRTQASANEEQIRTLRETALLDRRMAQEEALAQGRAEAGAEAGRQIDQIQIHIRTLEERLEVTSHELSLRSDKAERLALALAEAETKAARDMERAAEVLAGTRRDAEDRTRQALGEAEERGRRDREWFEGRLGQEREDAHEALLQARHQAQLQLEAAAAAAAEGRSDAERRAVAEARRGMEEDRAQWEAQVLSRCASRMEEASSQARRAEVELQSRVDELQVQMTRMKSEALSSDSGLRAQVQQLQHEVGRAQARAQAAEDRLVAEAEGLRGLLDGVQAESGRWKERAMDRERELERAMDRAAQMEARLNGLHEAGQSQAERAQDLEREVEVLRQRLSLREEEVRELGSHKSDLGSAVRLLEGKLQEIRQRFASLEQSHERLTAQQGLQGERLRAEAEQQVTAALAARDEAERRYAALEQHLGVFQSEASLKEDEMRLLVAAVDKLQGACKALETQEAEARQEAREVRLRAEERVASLRAMHAEEVTLLEEQARARLEDVQASYQGLMLTAQEKLQGLRAKQSRMVSQLGLQQDAAGTTTSTGGTQPASDRVVDASQWPPSSSSAAAASSLRGEGGLGSSRVAGASSIRGDNEYYRSLTGQHQETLQGTIRASRGGGGTLGGGLMGGSISRQAPAPASSSAPSPTSAVRGGGGGSFLTPSSSDLYVSSRRDQNWRSMPGGGGTIPLPLMPLPRTRPY